MTESNLNIVLTNALCCSATKAKEVSKLYSIGNSCADEELAKLKLLNDRIEALRCYTFGGTTSNSTFVSQELGEALWGSWGSIPTSNPRDLVTVSVNNVEYYINGDDVTSVKDLVIAKLTELGVYVSYSFETVGFNKIITFILTCEVTSFWVFARFDGGTEIPSYINRYYEYTNTVLGSCTVTPNDSINCLTEEQQDLMAHQIMATCDICDCQLTY